MAHLYAQHEALGDAMDARLCQFLCKKYKSHRDIPEFVGAVVDKLMMEFNKS